MKQSKKRGREYSEAEAIDILTQCKAIRLSLDALEEKARKALNKPELTVIYGNEKP